MLNNFKQKYRFSDIEIKHLLIGTLLFTAVMVSLFISSPSDLVNSDRLLQIILLLILTAPLFFLHELGHKYNAQNFNLWAEFRLDPNGSLLTAVSVFIPIKFVAPGAVMIRANDYSEVPAMGKVAAFGPAVNLFLGGIYLAVDGIFYLMLGYTNVDVSMLFQVFFYACGFSFFLGVFNMIPFGPLDGKKVNMWNQNVFWILFIMCGLLTLETYFSIFSNSPFLLGSYLLSMNFSIGIIYPFVLGIIIASIGYYLLINLKNANWEPGKKQIQYSSSDFYYAQSPQIKSIRGPTQHSSAAPMNAPCTECGKRDLLPFRCTSCNKIYCAEHRLPGKHFCVRE